MGTTGRVRATWYLLAVIPSAIGAAIAISGVSNLIRYIEDMPRVVAPGSGEVELEPGDYFIYGETESTFGNTAYLATSLQLRCGVQALPDGESIALSSPSARVNYRIGGYAGNSMFAVTVPRAGHYRMTCEGSGGPATLAFGTGIARRVVVLVLGILVGVFGAIGTALVVWIIRRRAARHRPALLPDLAP
jgi:hypothetical protein